MENGNTTKYSQVVQGISVLAKNVCVIKKCFECERAILWRRLAKNVRAGPFFLRPDNLVIDHFLSQYHKEKNKRLQRKDWRNICHTNVNSMQDNGIDACYALFRVIVRLRA